jgi:hypothetical protein
MIKKIFVGCFLILFLISPIMSAYADQPYQGAGFTCNQGYTDHVIFECSYPSTDGNSFTDGNWFGGVISVCGRHLTSPTGYIYQIGFTLTDTDAVTFCPMYLYEDGLQDYGDQDIVGDSDYNFFFGRIDYDSSNSRILYRSFAYDTAWDVEHDVCSVDEWEHSIPSGEHSFLYGCVTHNIEGVNRPIRFLQVGMEGNTVITETNWKVHLGHFSYYDNGWKYSGAKSMVGEWSLITWTDQYILIGTGDNYTNAHLYSYGTPTVTWDKGTMCPDQTSLWTGSGTLSPVVPTPFA